jgi:hypothetical protein
MIFLQIFGATSKRHCGRVNEECDGTLLSEACQSTNPLGDAAKSFPLRLAETLRSLIGEARS